MRIGGGGSSDINLLQSDAAQYRNADFVVSEGNAFMGRYSVAATAAKNGVVQLWNPAASGVVLLVDQVFGSVNTSLQLTLTKHDTQLAGASLAWTNMLLESAAGNGLLEALALTGIPGDEFFTNHYTADNSLTMKLAYPIIVQAGDGLVVGCGGVNAWMSATFVGREI